MRVDYKERFAMWRGRGFAWVARAVAERVALTPGANALFEAFNQGLGFFRVQVGWGIRIRTGTWAGWRRLLGG